MLTAWLLNVVPGSLVIAFACAVRMPRRGRMPG
jgi:hypothetical protein